MMFNVRVEHLIFALDVAKEHWNRLLLNASGDSYCFNFEYASFYKKYQQLGKIKHIPKASVSLSIGDYEVVCKILEEEVFDT